LIEEILEGQRKHLKEKERTELKTIVIEMRIAETRDRLTKEAGIKIQHGMLGGTCVTDEEDDE
jgi:hypothetical protein